VQGSSGLLIPKDRLRVYPRRCHGDQGGPGITGGGSRSNSGHCRHRNRGWRPRGVAWHRGEAAARLGRSWGAAERRVHGGAEARCSGAERGSGARVWGGCGVGDEGAERSRGGLNEGDRNLGDALRENGQRGSRRAWRGW
jgi:hypothetical protein